MPYVPPVAPPIVASAPAASLDQLRWRKRLVLVFAPTADDARLRYQVAELHRLTAQPDARDLHLVTVAGSRVDGVSDGSNALRARFHVVEGGYRTFLIGKDGHAAVRSTSPIPAEEIARTVDAMPMRKDEVRRR